MAPTALLLGLLSCLLAVSLAKDGNADAYIDQILNNAKNDPDIRAKIDPLTVDDVAFDNGNAHNIRIRGLLSLARTGPATLGSDGNSITIESSLGITGVTGEADYQYRALKFLKLKGSVGAKVDNVACAIKISIVGLQVKLDKFEVTGFSGVKITKFTGATKAFNWLGKFILDKVVSKQKDRLRNEIESKGREAITKALAKVDVKKFFPN